MPVSSSPQTWARSADTFPLPFATSGGDGSYAFNGLVPGLYRATIAYNASRVATATPAAPITVAGGGGTVQKHFLRDYGQLNCERHGLGSPEASGHSSFKPASSANKISLLHQPNLPAALWPFQGPKGIDHKSRANEPWA